MAESLLEIRTRERAVSRRDNPVRTLTTALAALLGLWAATPEARTFLVGSHADVADNDLTDGDCEGPTPVPGQLGSHCSLRAAVMQANWLAANAGENEHVIELMPDLDIQLAPKELLDDDTSAEFGDLNLTAPNITIKMAGVQGVTVNRRPVIRGRMENPTGFRVFDIPDIAGPASSRMYVFEDIVIANGRSVEGVGGGIRCDDGRIAIHRVKFEGNRSASGGAALDAICNIEIEDSHFTGSNSPSTDLNGTIRLVGNASTRFLHMARSSMYDNPNAAGIVAWAPNGGAAMVTILGSSFGSNRTHDLQIEGNVVATVRGSTFDDRVIIKPGGSLSLDNSLVQGSANPALSRAATATFISGGHNYVSSASSGTDLQATDLAGPRLPLETVEVFGYSVGLRPAGSVLKDKGAVAISDDNFGSCLATDQAGKPRAVGACDIGAIEQQRRIFVVPFNSDSPDVTPGDGLCDVSEGGAESCSLRAAVMEANALAQDHPNEAYEIRVANENAWLQVEPQSADENSAAVGDLDIYAPKIWIRGANALGVAATSEQRPYIEGNHAEVPFRTFDIRQSDYPFKHVRITDLRFYTADAGAGDGGAIRCRGQKLTIEKTGFQGRIVGTNGDILSTSCDTTIIRSQLEHNDSSSATPDALIYFYGEPGANSRLSIDKSLIKTRLNTAEYGLWITSELGHFTSASVQASTIYSDGGGIAVLGGANSADSGPVEVRSAAISAVGYKIATPVGTAKPFVTHTIFAGGADSADENGTIQAQSAGYNISSNNDWVQTQLTDKKVPRLPHSTSALVAHDYSKVAVYDIPEARNAGLPASGDGNGFCSPVDQIGQARGNPCDIGAIELDAVLDDELFADGFEGAASAAP